MTNNKDMDYKELYNKALDKAKFYYNNCPLDPEKNKLEDMFPALKESEDEKIRAEIIIYIGARQDIDLETHNRWCAYLEKQKEQKITPKFKVGDRIYDKSDSYNRNVIREVGKDYYINAFAQKMDMAYTDANFEFLEHLDNDHTDNKPVEWSDSVAKEMFIKALERAVEQTKKGYELTDCDKHSWWEDFKAYSKIKPAEWSEDTIRKAIEEVGLTQHQINWFKNNVFPPKQEWSEEDKVMLNNIIWSVHMKSIIKPLYEMDDRSRYKKYEDFLKALPERFNLQPKAEWSEEDKGILLECISVLQNSSHWLLADKLKSLRPQPHWKPSEEQMKFLKRTVDGWDITCRGQGALESLYVDLQKLLES